MWAHLSGVLKLGCSACLLTCGRDLSSSAVQSYNKSSNQSRSWASPCRLIMCNFDWCVTGALTKGTGHIDTISISQWWTELYLGVPADIPSINGAVHVLTNCQLAARFFVWLRRAGLASRGAHFPPSLCVKAIFRGRQKKVEGGNRREGRDGQWGNRERNKGWKGWERGESDWWRMSKLSGKKHSEKEII